MVRLRKRLEKHRRLRAGHLRPVRWSRCTCTPTIPARRCNTRWSWASWTPSKSTICSRKHRERQAKHAAEAEAAKAELKAYGIVAVALGDGTASISSSDLNVDQGGRWRPDDEPQHRGSGRGHRTARTPRTSSCCPTTPTSSLPRSRRRNLTEQAT